MQNDVLEITVLRNGRYDIAENIKIKTRNLVRTKGVEIASQIDYFFTQFGR